MGDTGSQIVNNTISSYAMGLPTLTDVLAQGRQGQIAPLGQTNGGNNNINNLTKLLTGHSLAATPPNTGSNILIPPASLPSPQISQMKTGSTSSSLPTPPNLPTATFGTDIFPKLPNGGSEPPGFPNVGFGVNPPPGFGI